MLKTAPFTLSAVGRMLRSSGEKSFLPRASPAMILKTAFSFPSHGSAAFSPQEYVTTNARDWQGRNISGPIDRFHLA
jgi:hypothetical protein